MNESRIRAVLTSQSSMGLNLLCRLRGIGDEDMETASSSKAEASPGKALNPSAASAGAQAIAARTESLESGQAERLMQQSEGCAESS